jgi:hypothetical protein
MPGELIIGAAIGAAVVSKHVRKAVRRGLIYGVGGVLVAYDRLAAGAHAIAQSAREEMTASKDGSATQATASPPSPATASPANTLAASLPAPPVAASPADGTPS